MTPEPLSAEELEDAALIVAGEEFLSFAEHLDPEIGPMFGRDAARLLRYTRALEAERGADKHIANAAVSFHFDGMTEDEFHQEVETGMTLLTQEGPP